MVWTSAPTANKVLVAISCTAAHACTAVGLAQIVTSGYTPLLAEQEQ